MTDTASVSPSVVLFLHNLLLSAYGDHPWRPHDPGTSLVLTILSQNTNDVNRGSGL